MTKERRIIKQWEQNAAPLTRWEQVSTILIRLGFKICPKKGSAIRIEHEKLAELDPENFGSIGGFTVYKTHAKDGPRNMISKRYLKKVVYAARLILDSDYLMEDQGETEN